LGRKTYSDTPALDRRQVQRFASSPTLSRAFYREGQGRVVIRLVQVGVLTGIEDGGVIIDSNVIDPGPGGPNRFHTALNNVEQLALDFNNNAYYIEVTLSAEVPPVFGLQFPPAVSVIQLVWGGGELREVRLAEWSPKSK
jgi:hypothetical protein